MFLWWVRAGKQSIYNLKLDNKIGFVGLDGVERVTF